MGKDIDTLASFLSKLPVSCSCSRSSGVGITLWVQVESRPKRIPPPRTTLEGSFLCSVEPWGVEIQQLLDTLPKYLPVLPLGGDPCSIRGAHEQVLGYTPYSYIWS